MTEFWGLLGAKLAAGFIQAQAPAIPLWEVLIVLLGAAALCLPAAWRCSSLITSLVHELGHAGAAVSAGRIVTAIRIHPDHSGETHTFGLAGAPALWSMFWGYPVPSIIGGTLLWAALAGWAQAALTVGGLLALLSLLAIRNRFGAVVVLACAAVPLAFVWLGDPQIGAYAALLLGAVLLAGSLRSFGEVLAVHTKYRDDLESSDAHHLARETGIPAGVWLTLFGTGIAGSLYVTLIAVAPLLHAVG
ncbi:M50 family metallopeptidase [Arthrobacter sp. 162MFSha1.1]|uniref:M50 family metallopeptidase n=1 Tax=Arthrobacter sp. 162MFSha1.1 TaxID=1151119 RepID=UPI0018CB9530|nr:M50 family metallopeptidase [Arthrobacter sp. 162MFSha1.1]